MSHWHRLCESVRAEAEPDAATGKRSPLPDKTKKGWQSGGGGLVSTAGDYARFCQMLLNGGELDGVRIMGIDLAIRGLLTTFKDDQEALAHGMTLFDGLYAALNDRP